MRKSLSVVALIAATALSMAACGTGAGDNATTSGDQTATEAPTSAPTDQDAPADTPADPAPDAAGELIKLKIGASPVPHGLILEFVQENLAAAAGLDLDIILFDDYILPNKGLEDGSLDANYFQHQPYLDAQVAEFGYDFFAFPGVHIEPLGVYTAKGYTGVDELPDGATVSLSRDPANQARGLRLLESAGLFTLKDTGAENPTIFDLAENPKNIKLTELDPEVLAPSLPDVDASVINGNYAIEANLTPSKDAIVLESGQNSPFANFVVVRTPDKDKPELLALDELLHSDQVRQFIVDTYPDGGVIPAF